MSKSKYVESTPTGITFDFVCEGCGSEGELKIPLEIRDFSCPEGCGARYVIWDNPPKLMCVVKPIFINEQEADDA